MLRGLIAGALAAGVGLFAASLLRTEHSATGASAARSAGGGRCVARTAAGDRCSRPAEPGSDRCWQHG